MRHVAEHKVLYKLDCMHLPSIFSLAGKVFLLLISILFAYLLLSFLNTSTDGDAVASSFASIKGLVRSQNISTMTGTAQKRTPVYFLSHGGVSQVNAADDLKRF